MAFIQDPRMRQRWNQISHNAEAVTENAAAGIWTFQHTYITPCLDGLGSVFDSCTGVCFGDREERARRARERSHGARRTRAEYTFDFYDDWDEADDEDPVLSGSGILGSWGGGRSEDWDRLLAGTGGRRGKHGATAAGDVVDQPRRKRGMSYGTRGVRRKASGEEDPNVIPRTAPLGFLGRLPFKIGGTLRYKPSAANLQDHPGAPSHENDEGREHEHENEPLLGPSDDEVDVPRRRSPQSRPRSNTANSGDTSSSYRSRGDLFPSDGEGDEDAVPLDDEFAVALDRVDYDRGSNKTRSTKGKRKSGMSRTVSGTTMSSTRSRESLIGALANDSTPPSPFLVLEDEEPAPPSLEDLQREEERAAQEELDEIERRRRAASQLALQRGLSKDDSAPTPPPEPEPKKPMGEVVRDIVARDEMPGDSPEEPPIPRSRDVHGEPAVEEVSPAPAVKSVADVAEERLEDQTDFVPARLPQFR